MKNHSLVPHLLALNELHKQVQDQVSGPADLVQSVMNIVSEKHRTTLLAKLVAYDQERNRLEKAADEVWGWAEVQQFRDLVDQAKQLRSFPTILRPADPQQNRLADQAAKKAWDYYKTLDDSTRCFFVQYPTRADQSAHDKLWNFPYVGSHIYWLEHRGTVQRQAVLEALDSEIADTEKAISKGQPRL